LRESTQKIHFAHPRILLGLLIFAVISCSDPMVESESDKAIRLLSNNGDKYWIIEQILLDDVNQTLTSCDSSLVLTIRNDNTWTEAFLRITCYQLSEGSWSLNDENNVLSISFINKYTGNEVTKDLEINELSEERFEYQEISSNQIKKISLVEL